MLKRWIELLYNSRNKTPQEQRDLVIDIKRRGFLKQVIQVTLAGAFAGTCCAVNEYSGNLPDLGDSDRSSLTPFEADFLGRQVIDQVATTGNLINDYDTLAYLNDVGDNLVSYSPLAGFDFNFYIINEKVINAFALPGGYICIYNGLIYNTLSEAELISVMSHEIGHVVQHHIYRNIAAYNRNQWLAVAGILAGGLLAAANPGAAILAASGGQGLALQNLLAFSRDFEREADRVGQRLMYQAGFDPDAMPLFFERLQDTNKFNDNGAYEFLRTHPVTTERIAEAEERARNWHVKMRPDSDSFLLVREKCRVRQLTPNIAINFYQQSIQNKKYTSLDAQYYGLAFANFMNQKYALALKSLKQIVDPAFLGHPIVMGLNAQILLASKDYSKASRLYNEALENYPSYKALWLGQVDVYLNSRNYPLAANKLDSLSQSYPQDLDIWLRQASLYSDGGINNQQRYFYALGNVAYLQGDYKRAVDSYQHALSQTKDVDSVLNDVISAKILDAKSLDKLKSSLNS